MWKLNLQLGSIYTRVVARTQGWRGRFVEHKSRCVIGPRWDSRRKTSQLVLKATRHVRGGARRDAQIELDFAVRQWPAARRVRLRPRPVRPKALGSRLVDGWASDTRDTQPGSHPGRARQRKRPGAPVRRRTGVRAGQFRPEGLPDQLEVSIRWSWIQVLRGPPHVHRETRVRRRA